MKASQWWDQNSQVSWADNTKICSTPLSDVELRNLKESAIPLYTRNKAKWAEWLFKCWQAERRIQKPLLKMTKNSYKKRVTDHYQWGIVKENPRIKKSVWATLYIVLINRQWRKHINVQNYPYAFRKRSTHVIIKVKFNSLC